MAGAAARLPFNRGASRRFTGKFDSQRAPPAAAPQLLGGPAAGNFRTALDKCRADANEVVAILSRQTGDVQELVQTARSVLNTLARVAARTANSAATDELSSKLVYDEVKKLKVIVGEYLALLVDVDAKGQLAKQLNSSRGRRRFEQFNSSLLVEATILAELSEDIMMVHDKNYQKLPSFDDAPEEQVEIIDPEGYRMWVDQFGATTFMVDVNKVVQGIMRSLQVKLTTKERKILLQVLDPSNTGQISSLRWSEFLKGFGPMSHCLYNLQGLLSRPWFHGFLSKDDSTKLLEVEPQGTFLIRFSSTRPGSFSLAHTMNPGEVNHVIIHTRENGFAIREDNEQEKLFPSVSHLIEAYSTILVKPYSQTFSRQLWWHGDITGEEANALLQGKKPGTFLIRFSATQTGCFASSYVDANSNIEKGLILGSPHGYRLSGKLFSSMEEIVESLVRFGIFTEPYKNTTNEVNDKMRLQIVKEMLSTEASYVKALDVMVRVLVPRFKANSKISPTDTATIFSNTEKLLAFHTSFLQTLERVCTYWEPDDTACGPHFIAISRELPNAYAPYVNNYNASMATIEKLLGVKGMPEFIKSVLDENLGDDSYQNALQGYLIQPVQRIPRYVLLLTDLIKHTSGAHSDYDALCEAKECMRNAADAVNESQRAVDNLEKVAAAAKQVTGLEALPSLAVMGRALIKEGKLLPLENGHVRSKDYYVFLFNDILLICKRRSEKKYAYKDQMQLRQVKVVGLPDSGTVKHAIRLHGLDSELTVCCETAPEKDEWIDALKGVVAKLNPAPAGGGAAGAANGERTASFRGGASQRRPI